MIEIKDLSRKLLFLEHRGVIRGALSRKKGKEIAEMLGISPPAYSGYKSNGVIPPDKEEILSEEYGFSVIWEEWRIGGVDRFQDKYFKEHSSAYQRKIQFQQNFSKENGEQKEPEIDQLTTERDGLKLSNVNTRCIDQYIATHILSGSSQQSQDNDNLPIFLEFDISEISSDSNVSYGFRCVRLNLNTSSRSVASIAGRLGSGSGCNIRDAEIVSRGTSNSPFWEIKSPCDQYLSGHYITSDDPLFWIENVTHGIEIISDVCANICSGVVLVDGAPTNLSDNKNAMISVLASKELEQEMLDIGWLRLSSFNCNIERIEL